MLVKLYTNSRDSNSKGLWWGPGNLCVYHATEMTLTKSHMLRNTTNAINDVASLGDTAGNKMTGH